MAIRTYTLNGQTVTEKRSFVKRARMSGNTVYSYCPICRKEMLKLGKDVDQLTPLTAITEYVEQECNGQHFNAYDLHYECSRCHAKLTVDDFSKAYGDLALKERGLHATV